LSQAPKRILFLCSRNKLRSPTAESIFSDRGDIEVDSAGLNSDAELLLSAEQVEWADLIVVMESRHREKLNRNYRAFLAGKRIVVLNIADNYEYMDPQLIELLKQRCTQLIP
jgi:predicted protein tyrosine phosphatase